MLLAVLLTFGMTVGVFADAGKTQQVDYKTDYYMIVESPDGGVDMYSEADASSPKLNDELIPNGTAIHVEGETTDEAGMVWVYAQLHGMFGFLEENYLKPATLAEAVASELVLYGSKDANYSITVNAKEDGSVCLYKGPGKKYGTVSGGCNIANGEKLYIDTDVDTGKDGIWGHTEAGDVSGWVNIAEATNTEESTVELVPETEKEAEVEKKVETTKSESVSNNNFKSDVDVVETLKNRGASTTPSFTISDAQGNFINSHINLFPAEFSDFEEVSNYIDYTLDYAHMAKNPKSYIGKFAFVDGLKVIQVAEQEYNYGSSQYNYVTVMTLKDDSEHIYVVYYIGKSIELVQGDYARIIAMPIEYSSYKNLENNSVLSLVMVASVAENSDQKEITNGYFSDEPDYSGIAENTNTQDDYYIFPDSDSRYYTISDWRIAVCKW